MKAFKYRIFPNGNTSTIILLSVYIILLKEKQNNVAYFLH